MKMLLVGATGAVGTQLLKLLLTEPKVDEIIVAARKPSPTVHNKLKWHQPNMEELESFVEHHQPDHIFCTLGTTIKIAGSKEAFRNVDYQLPLALALGAAKVSCQSLHIVSAVGADPTSKLFYNRVKGEMERDVETLGSCTTLFYQPSLIAGDREEFRIGEAFANVLLKPFYKLLPTSFRPIYPKQIAMSMLQHALSISASDESVQFRRVSNQTMLEQLRM